MKNATTTVYASSLVVSELGATVHGVSGYNSKASAQFIQLYDASALPADGSVPKVVISVAATSNFSIDFGFQGREFKAGVVIGNSSTAPTKTIGSADCWLDVQFI
jgi:hypothetical protein